MHSRSQDIELWFAFKEGDRDAFGELFKRYYSLLFQYGTKLCTDPAIVEDCIQELFTELWHNKPASKVLSVKAYLLVALKYKVFKIFRNRPDAKSFEEVQDNTSFEIGHENFIIAREESRQKTELILTALNKLPPRQKEIIYLKMYQGLGYDEISEVMGINYQAARNLFSQSIKALRMILGN